MRLSLDLNTVEGYRTFLKVKALPVHRFVGREAYFPDEYADRIGVERSKDKPSKYVPRPWLFDYQRDIATTAIGLTVPHGWDGSPIAMAVTPSPEPSTSTSGTGPTTTGDGTDTASDGDGTSASGSNGSSGVWVLLGTIVAVAVVGVLARRSSRATRPRGRA